MIFVFHEDGKLDLVESKEEACKIYPGRDVDTEYFVFYDDDGNYLSPHFIVPNRRVPILNSYFGITFWDKDGTYELKFDPQIGSREDPIWLMLHECRQLNPNKYFETLEDVKTYLESRGVAANEPRS